MLKHALFTVAGGKKIKEFGKKLGGLSEDVLQAWGFNLYTPWCLYAHLQA